MKKMQSAVVLVVAGISLGLVGCEPGAKVIEQDQSITTVEQIDIQDFRAAAATLTKEMLTSPRFSTWLQTNRTASPGRLPLMKISRIKNDTTLKVDMRGFLVDPIENELFKANLCDFYAEDDQAQQLAKMNETLNGSQPRLPNLILYGTVRDLRSEAGDIKQASYVFQLKLADAQGVTVWQDEKLITKQGAKPKVGM